MSPAANDSLSPDSDGKFRAGVPFSTLLTLPSLQDERDAYDSEGLTREASDENLSPDGWTSGLLNGWDGTTTIHDDTEGDDLWMALHQFHRYDGINQSEADNWFTRAQNMRDWMVSNLQSQVAGDQNADHLYGWGLTDWIKDQGPDSAALSTLNAVRADLAANTDVYANEVVGNRIFAQGNAGRRWARWLRFAVALAEVDDQSANVTFRDQVIDLVLNDPGWDEPYAGASGGQMPWFDRAANSIYDTLDHAGNDRVVLLFHMGLFADAMWHAWRVLDAESDARASDVRTKLVQMADFWMELSADAGDRLHELGSGRNLDTGAVLRVGGSGTGNGNGVSSGVGGIYRISPINNLVSAYKFTNDASYLTEAWNLWKDWQQITANDVAGVVDHFVDTYAPDSIYWGNNKGELQYVYSLFENGGSPSLVSGVAPSWWPAVGQWVDLSTVSGVDTLNDHAETPYSASLGFGTTDPEAKFTKWCGGADDGSYLYIGAEGGHQGGYDNAVFRVGPFNTEAGPRWERLVDRSVDADVVEYSNNGNSPYYLDGKPSSRHGRGLSAIVHGVSGFQDRFFHVGAHDPLNGAGVTDFSVDACRLDDLAWDAGGTYGDMPNIGSSVRSDAAIFDSVRQKVLRLIGGGTGTSGFQWFDPVTDTWESAVTGQLGSVGNYGRFAIAPDKGVALAIEGSGTTTYIVNLDDLSDVVNLGSITSWAGNGGSCFAPDMGTDGAFLVWGGGQRIDKIEIPSDYMSGGSLNQGASWASVNMGMGGATPSAAQPNGTFGRFCYVGGVVYVVNNTSEQGWVARVA